MDTVYDCNGDAIGWLREDVLYDNNDRYRAIVLDGEIYQLGSSQFLGCVERGFIWDRNGMVVACLETASPPPSLPEFHAPPDYPDLAAPADTSVAQRSGSPLRLTDRWSQRTWVRFLDGL